MGVCKNSAPIRLVFHDPRGAIFSFHSKKKEKKDQREKITLNVGFENDLCPDSENLIVYFSVFLKLFSVFGFFISLFVVGIVRQRMRFRFCTRKVPGTVGGHYSFFDDCSHFQKKKEHTQDSRTMTQQ
jgi:hypothetical protein